tara:strand:+ start:354 stop:1154 length:801 start_codon:yes stop_codon:yes gene_type:complete
MADIKWIKITVDIFDDEKIKLIDCLPDRDCILVVWFKLLALTGKKNESGMLFMSPTMAYTDEMLSTIFNRPLNSVRLALSTFQDFGMIEINDNQVINVINWDKHQNIEGMDKIREQNRARQQKRRAKQKTLPNKSNVKSRDSHAIEEEKKKSRIEEDKNRIEKNKENISAFDSTLNDFYDMRKKIRAPMTDRAKKLLINQLKKLAPDNEGSQIQILEQSIINSWKSVYALKEPKKKFEQLSVFDNKQRFGSYQVSAEDLNEKMKDW